MRDARASEGVTRRQFCPSPAGASLSLVRPAAGAAVDRFVARQNVEHFRQQLAAEPDLLKRERLSALLKEALEQLRLAELAHAKPKG